MKKKIGLMLLGILVVSQVSVFAWTNFGDGTRGTAYGSVFTGDTGNRVNASYTLNNMNANGRVRITVPNYGSNESLVASRTRTYVSTSYTYAGFSVTGAHTHSYSEALVQ